jgi:hypothetical protein
MKKLAFLAFDYNVFETRFASPNCETLAKISILFLIRLSKETWQ